MNRNKKASIWAAGLVSTAFLVLCTFSMCSMQSCGPGGRVGVEDMSQDEFDVLLADIRADTGILAAGWLSENQSDRDEVQTAVGLFNAIGGGPLTPETLKSLEAQGLAGSVILIAARRAASRGMGSVRGREMLAAFTLGLEDALGATEP